MVLAAGLFAHETAALDADVSARLSVHGAGGGAGQGQPAPQVTDRGAVSGPGWPLVDEVAGASPVEFALLGGGSRTVWSLAQARVVISDWKADYNHGRRHSQLAYQAPAVYAAARTHQ